MLCPFINYIIYKAAKYFTTYLFLIEFLWNITKSNSNLPTKQSAPAFSWKYSIHISAEINADLQANLCLALKINSAL